MFAHDSTRPEGSGGENRDAPAGDEGSAAARGSFKAAGVESKEHKAQRWVHSPTDPG